MPFSRPAAASKWGARVWQCAHHCGTRRPRRLLRLVAMGTERYAARTHRSIEVDNPKLWAVEHGTVEAGTGEGDDWRSWLSASSYGHGERQYRSACTHVHPRRRLDPPRAALGWLLAAAVPDAARCCWWRSLVSLAAPRSRSWCWWWPCVACLAVPVATGATGGVGWILDHWMLHAPRRCCLPGRRMQASDEES